MNIYDYIINSNFIFRMYIIKWNAVNYIIIKLPIIWAFTIQVKLKVLPYVDYIYSVKKFIRYSSCENF